MTEKNRNVVPFDPKELVIQRRIAAFGGISLPVFSYPVSMREGVNALMARKPLWEISNVEMQLFMPSVLPDAIARAFVMEVGSPFGSGGGKDMFGIDWEFIPTVGGSMVRPGAPFLEDANDWTEKIVWPDIDAWDWAGSAEKNREFSDGTRSVRMAFMNGWFERLVSLMDFSGAVLALIDEEQKDAVKTFFERLTDLYIRILDKAMDSYPFVEGFWIHDDWGGQKDTFFSPATCAEMIVPHMRRLTDHVHARGRYCEFHSCGQNLKQVPNMIDAGWDAWTPQRLNDLKTIYDLYGDRLIIGIDYPWPGPDTPEEEQRAAAARFARDFCVPGKPSYLSANSVQPPTDITREELYSITRALYAG